MRDSVPSRNTPVAGSASAACCWFNVGDGVGVKLAVRRAGVGGAGVKTAYAPAPRLHHHTVRTAGVRVVADTPTQAPHPLTCDSAGALIRLH